MANFSSKDEEEKRKAAGPGRTGPSPAEAIFQKATDLYQHGEISAAMRFYKQLIDQYPGDPKADLAKTLVAGLQREEINVLWNTASDARSQCNAQDAIKLYKKIITDFPDSPEAKSASIEIANISEIQQIWSSALDVQSQGDEPKALELYRQIVERYPNSPEAENAGLLSAIIHQNQLIPRGEVAQAFKFKQTTPAMILSNLLAHKKTTSGGERDLSPEERKEDIQTKKIENIWTQAVDLEKNGNVDEAVILYKKIVASSTNGHRVRDANYKIEKIQGRSASILRSYSQPAAWGIEVDSGRTVVQKLGSKKAALAAGLILMILVAGILFYRANMPPTWTDVVENAKKAIVVVKTPMGAGTGFLISSDGSIITNAQVIGKERDIDVRLYSGVLRKASVVKAGSKLLDIAVLKIEGVYDQYLPLTDFGDCIEGMEIRVLGAPLGLEYFITKGIVSHCNLDRDGVRYIQTDTAINVGNSGGPCLNIKGKVIGLSTTIQVDSDPKSLNLILPITVVKDFMDGKLTTLEETLIRKEEERARQLEENKKTVYTDIENITRRLEQTAEVSHTDYLAKVNDLFHRRLITTQQADIMVEQVKYGPSGSIPMSQWVRSLAVKVAKGELSEDSAANLIKAQYKTRE